MSRWRGAGVLILLAAAVGYMLGLLAAPPAQAAEGDPYRISGIIRLDGEALPDVTLVIDGPGGQQEVVTGEDGRWQVFVPEQAVYTVTLDESTLPEGIAVIDETGATETPNVREANLERVRNVTVNFFLGEGERSTTGFFEQFLERLVNGLNFGLMLALAAIGLSLVYGTTGISTSPTPRWSHLRRAHGAAVLGAPRLPLWLAIPLAVVASAAFGYAMDLGLWRPLRRKASASCPS